MTEQISPFIRMTLQPSSDGGVEAPDNILKTASAAYNQYSAMRLEQIDRNIVYAGIDGMIGGNPPYDEAELAEAGLEHLTNYNNFKARSSYEKEAQGLWNLINSTDVFTKIVLSKAAGVPNATEWARVIAKNFSDCVKKWPDFNVNFNLLGNQLTRYGYSPVVFPNEKCPLWDVVRVSRFYIPSQSETKSSKLTTCAIDVPMTIQELYSIYKKASNSTSTKNRWNKDALGDFLMNHANALSQNEQNPILNPVDLQSFISNNDAAVNTYFTDIVKITHMYQVEFDTDKKVSHYIISPDIFSDVKKEENEGIDFLFFGDRQYDSIEQAIIIFTATPGEWTIHGNLGMGQKMFAGAQAVNMLDCGLVDNAKMSLGMLVKSLAQGGRDFSPIRVYPGVATDIGASEFVPNTLGANLDKAAFVSQYISQGLEKNAANSGNDPSRPDASQGSIAPSTAVYRAFDEFGVLRNNVHHFYNTFDKVIRMMFIRFLSCPASCDGYKYAKEFLDRCEQDGVPEELLDYAKTGLDGLPIQYRDVKAARVAGDGSTVARIMGLDSIANLVPMFNEDERSEYKKERVAAALGTDYIETFASSDSIPDETSGGHSLAVVENGMMSMGQPAGFSPDNNQAAHAETHLALIIDTIQKVQQKQISAVDAARILDLIMPHEAEHIKFMGQSPNFYGQTLSAIDAPWKQAAQFAQLNKRNAEAMIAAAKEKAQQEAAATNETLTDIQRKDAVAQADIARKDADNEAKNVRADKANDTRADIMKDKAQTDIEIKREKAAVDKAVKQNATAKGRTQADLATKSVDELGADLSSLIGNTPSSVDFEPSAKVPGTKTPRNK